MKPEAISSLCALWQHINTKLGPRRTKFLLTHMDKVDVKKETFYREFGKYGVDAVDIFFAAKETHCTCQAHCNHWTEETLQQYRELFAGLQAFIDNITDFYN